MGDLARIVFCQAGAKIGSEADIALIGVRETVEDVGIVHDLFLYFFGHPQLGDSRAKDGGGGATRTQCPKNRGNIILR